MLVFFNIYFTFLLILEGGEGREKERESIINGIEKHRWIASCTRPAGNQTRNPGMRPDQETNLRLFSLQDDAQPTEPHWLGPMFILLCHAFHLVPLGELFSKPLLVYRKYFIFNN